MVRIFKNFFILCILIILAVNNSFGQKQPTRPNLLWTYNAPGTFPWNFNIRSTVDASDNVFFLSNLNPYDLDSIGIRALKVNPAGVQLYEFSFRTPTYPVQSIHADVAGFAYILSINNLSKINQAGTGFIFQAGPIGMSQGFAMAMDAGANLYIAGQHNGDAAVSKVDTNGNVLWVRTLGGSGYDEAFGITLDSANNIWIVGRTSSSNLPVQNAFQSGFGGDTDAFVAKFDPNGNPTFSSYLGGVGYDEGLAIAADRFGNVHVGGDTASANFPTLNPIQANLKGPGDGFVTRISRSGTLLYSSFLGGSGFDQIEAMDVDFQTATYVTGRTYSSDFPLFRSLQTVFVGNWQGFLTKINPNGASFEYSTYQIGDQNHFFEGQGLNLDSQGNVILGIKNNLYQSGGDAKGHLQKFSRK